MNEEQLAFRGAAIGHTLDLDEVWLADIHQPCVVFHFLSVPALDQRQAVHRPLALLLQLDEALNEPLPEIFEKGSVNLLEGVFGRRVDGDVELRHRRQVADGVGELRVRHEKGRNSTFV